MRRTGPARLAAITVLPLALAACGGDILLPDASAPDLAAAPPPDLAAPPEEDLATPPNECGDHEPGCTCLSLARPFPLASDQMPLPGVTSDGTKRDADGHLVLAPKPVSPNVVWIANGSDGSRGTISKLDGRTLRETARYLTATCSSNAEGSSASCDGRNGCCARDDGPRFRNRLANLPEGPRQQVPLGFLSPSRTAVDADGNVFVVNRSGSPPSVTRIAYKKADCVDRNKNGRIDTSTDTNSDGFIDTDCNDDGQMDDVAAVKQRPCTNNLPQEFYGLDDECVLWTTTFDQGNQPGRGAALDPAGNLWVTSYVDAQIYEIDAQTGKTKAQTTLLAGCTPDGLAIDAQGIGWIVSGSGQGSTCYFDTHKPSAIGKVRAAQGMPFATGISIDRDGNVWHAAYGQSGGALRYAPDRSAFDKLGNGYWTTFTNLAANAGNRNGGSAVAADARKGGYAWVLLGSGGLTRIPIAAWPPKPADQTVDGSAFIRVPLAGTTAAGVALDVDGNVWAAYSFPSVVTRVQVDANGNATEPDLTSSPAGNNHCPAGDTCPLRNGQSDPGTSAYTAFTPYNAAFSSLPSGRYVYPFDGTPLCPAPSWRRLAWTADVPAATTLVVRARPEPVLAPAEPWQGPYFDSPQDIDIDTTEGHLQVELNMSTRDAAQTPRVTELRACFRCP